MTKLIVETSFLVLVEAGAIELESRLVDVVPEFGRVNPRAIGGGQDPHTRARFYRSSCTTTARPSIPSAVTFRHLLTHTSGLPPWRSVYLSAADRPPPPPTRIDRIRELIAGGAAWMPCWTFPSRAPSATRYAIAISASCSSAKRSRACTAGGWTRRLPTLALEPLGLRFLHATIRCCNGIARERIVPTELDNHWRHRRAWGEVHDENACGVGGIAGHAGLFANARDVARFGQAWLSGDERLAISADLRRRATSQQANGQFRLGLGWMLKAD